MTDRSGSDSVSGSCYRPSRGTWDGCAPAVGAATQGVSDRCSGATAPDSPMPARPIARVELGCGTAPP